MRFSGEQMRMVTVEKKTTTTNDFNEEVESWSAASLPELDSGKMYVQRWDQGGKETTNGQTVAYADVKFKCRYVKDLDPVENRNALSDYRLNENGRIYDIEHVKQIGRNEGLKLTVEMQDNQ